VSQGAAAVEITRVYEETGNFISELKTIDLREPEATTMLSAFSQCRCRFRQILYQESKLRNNSFHNDGVVTRVTF